MRITVEHLERNYATGMLHVRFKECIRKAKDEYTPEGKRAARILAHLTAPFDDIEVSSFEIRVPALKGLMSIRTAEALQKEIDKFKDIPIKVTLGETKVIAHTSAQERLLTMDDVQRAHAGGFKISARFEVRANLPLVPSDLRNIMLVLEGIGGEYVKVESYDMLVVIPLVGKLAKGNPWALVELVQQKVAKAIF
ncbi:MAG TPA: hypothetical protein VFZ48_03145 [Candidatus Saccharimonadales bacterium]